MPKRKTSRNEITPGLIKRIREERDKELKKGQPKTEKEIREKKRRKKEILAEAERIMKQKPDLTRREAIRMAIRNALKKKMHGGNF